MSRHQRQRLRRTVLLLCMGMSPAPAFAISRIEAPAPPASVARPTPAQITELQGVSVSGVQPGPGLWKVSRGEHVLWVLGTLAVLPKGMQWQAREVQAAIASSQQVLDKPQLKFDAKLGFFGTLGILPSLIGLRNNPDGRHLVDVVPPDQYARWLVLKAKYLGHDAGVERQRPIFAAFALFIAAIKAANLTDDMIEPVLKKAARQHGLTPTPVAYTVTVDAPRAVVQDFKKSPLQDSSCFAKTLDHLDSDVALMRARANAWASGDLDALSQLPLSDQLQVCLAAVNQSGMADELGLTDVEAHIESTWVAAAEKALAANRVTFSQLPMERLLGPRPYLSALQAQGDAVTPPEGLGHEAPASAASAPAHAVSAAGTLPH